MVKILRTPLCLSMLIAVLAACSPLSLFTSAATKVAETVADERSTNTMVSDASIKTQLIHAFVQKDVNDMLVNVDPYVHEGRVLLTGKANSQETVIEVVNIAWGIVGVREVINELKVDARDQPDSYAKDAVISGQVKSRLFLEKNINSVNYTVETVDGVVYMMGIAQDQIELERAAAVAATTSGVRKVVSHVRLKDSEYRK